MFGQNHVPHALSKVDPNPSSGPSFVQLLIVGRRVSRRVLATLSPTSPTWHLRLFSQGLRKFSYFGQSSWKCIGLSPNVKLWWPCVEREESPRATENYYGHELFAVDIAMNHLDSGVGYHAVTNDPHDRVGNFRREVDTYNLSSVRPVRFDAIDEVAPLSVRECDDGPGELFSLAVIGGQLPLVLNSELLSLRSQYGDTSARIRGLKRNAGLAFLG